VSVFAQQASTTSLIGRVTDTAGAAISNATVKAVEDGTHQTYTRQSNVAGLFYFELVQIGTYTITESLRDKLRPGDIYTHCFSGHREEVLEDGKLNPAHDGRPKTGHLLRHWLRIGKLLLVRGLPGLQGWLPSRFRLDRFA
jgi:hypothetical protein